MTNKYLQPFQEGWRGRHFTSILQPLEGRRVMKYEGGEGERGTPKLNLYSDSK